MQVQTGNAYERWLTFVLRHTYFSDSTVPAALVPTASTNEILRRNGAVFRRESACIWSLCVQSGRVFGAPTPDTGGVLCFEVRPTSSDFYRYSAPLSGTYDGWSIAQGDAPGVWRVLEVPFDDFVPGNAQQRIEVEVQAVERHLEFLLIPRHNPSEFSLRLVHHRSDWEFGAPQPVRLWDTGSVVRIVSNRPCSLRHPRPSAVELWEVRGAGQKLLSNNVPIPSCSSPSPLSPKDTITTYFYY